jgi:hypothetical protein
MPPSPALIVLKMLKVYGRQSALNAELLLHHLFQSLLLPFECRIFFVSVAEEPSVSEDFEDFLFFLLTDPFETWSGHGEPPVRYRCSAKRNSPLYFQRRQIGNLIGAVGLFSLRK